MSAPAIPDNLDRMGEHLGTRMIPIDDLVPHPMNANIMPEDLLEKLRAHIKRTRRYPFIVVRPHPKDTGKYEILDGHHRVKILRDLNYLEVRCDIWDVSDREAKILLATLNRLEGQDLPIRRAQLVHELLGEINVGDLAGLLPEEEKQLEDLHTLLEFPAEEVAAKLEEEAQQAEKVMPKVVHFVLTPEQEELVMNAVERASDGTPGKDRKARGLVKLAEHFMKEKADEPIVSEGA